MITLVSKEIISNHLDLAIRSTIEFTKHIVTTELPEKYRFVYYTDKSVPLEALVLPTKYSGEGNSSYLGSILTKTELLDLLFLNGTVPMWVNLNVLNVIGDVTLFEVMSGMGYSDDYDKLMHQTEGYPPFHSLSPNLPPDFVWGQKLTLPSRRGVVFPDRIDL